MGRPARHMLDDSLAALTIGVHQSAARRKVALLDTMTGEYEQQVHVPLAGAATAGWAFVDKVVNWELPFLYAPAQRRVPFATPHFTHGIEFRNPPTSFVMLHAALVKWTVNEAGWTVGATLRFGVIAPGATSPVPYAAVAHLSFQGYATSAEQGDE